MATGYRIGGADLDELYEMPHVEHLTRTNLSVRTEANIITSGRYRKNGQPIKTAIQKTLFGSGYFDNPYHSHNFLVNGVNQPLHSKGRTPFGYLLATLGVGEHELTESNGRVYLDGSELPYAPVADTLFCILSAGGGGGASGLADGAAANGRQDGAAGSLGAGGSGAGYTAFDQSAGGKGGDGVVYIYY